MCGCRAETDAVLVSAGVQWQPFSDLALAELPLVTDPDAWRLPEEEALCRRDLRGLEYFICSIDPPGNAWTAHDAASWRSCGLLLHLRLTVEA